MQESSLSTFLTHDPSEADRSSTDGTLKHHCISCNVALNMPLNELTKLSVWFVGLSRRAAEVHDGYTQAAGRTNCLQCNC
ncbi:hypothetical protein F7725_028102 [Dissostichus mawsoni]|uniref:Uncharacterized protein n=1 Tax=Dissostichus mawsoni TaxID=36200 RepID=A0A7J5XEX9_DISMA|nr:hypothetical protein F7725_028102 [Dissostichus mawsoni]